MSSVGQILREAREAKGLTLYDLQEKTKIQPRYLKAIEEDRLDVLPGHFYARAFIRTYAEHVGVDPQPLLSQIQTPESDELESVQTMQRVGRRVDRVKEPSFSLAKWFSRGLLILFLVLVGTVIYTFVDGASMGMNLFSGKDKSEVGQAEGETDDSQGAGKSDEPQEEEDDTDGDTETVPTVEKTDENGANVYYKVSGANELIMKVETTAPVWFEVRNGGQDGDVVTSKEVAAGHKEEFTSEEGLFIRTGNTRGVILTVNDEDVSTDYAQAKNFIFELVKEP